MASINKLNLHDISSIHAQNVQAKVGKLGGVTYTIDIKGKIYKDLKLRDLISQFDNTSKKEFKTKKTPENIDDFKQAEFALTTIALLGKVAHNNSPKIKRALTRVRQFGGNFGKKSHIARLIRIHNKNFPVKLSFAHKKLISELNKTFKKNTKEFKITFNRMQGKSSRNEPKVKQAEEIVYSVYKRAHWLLKDIDDPETYRAILLKLTKRNKISFKATLMLANQELASQESDKNVDFKILGRELAMINMLSEMTRFKPNETTIGTQLDKYDDVENNEIDMDAVD